MESLGDYIDKMCRRMCSMPPSSGHVELLFINMVAIMKSFCAQ